MRFYFETFFIHLHLENVLNEGLTSCVENSNEW